MNRRVHASFQISVFIFFGWIPRTGITGSYDSSIFTFLGILHTNFCSGCTKLHFHQHCTRAPISPHSCQYSIVVLLIIAIVADVRWYFTVVLIYIFLMTSDVEHLFICLLTDVQVFLEKWYQNSSRNHGLKVTALPLTWVPEWVEKNHPANLNISPRSC